MGIIFVFIIPQQGSHQKLIYFLTKWKTGHHHGQRVNIKKDLGKNGKFLPEELVGEVHCSVQDTWELLKFQIG